MAKIGRFQMVDMQTWKGITKPTHLSAIYQKAPQKYPGVMHQLLTRRYGRSMDALLSKFPTKSFESDDEYTWQVVGSSRRNVPLIEARKYDGTVVSYDTNSNIGAHLEPFYLVFGEDWFSRGETIVGNLNEVYPMRVLEDPRFEGSQYIYKVELTGGNTDGIPSERLLAGERFSIEASYVEREMSRKVGDRVNVTLQLIAA